MGVNVKKIATWRQVKKGLAQRRKGAKKASCMEDAVRFLRENGLQSLVSLGCGRRINRIDNHLRIWCALELDYYVGIDKADWIAADWDGFFVDPAQARAALKERALSPDTFLQRMRLFPGTRVESLWGVPCRAVVCQRVLPFHHWEEVIASMAPEWVLQEDLHGCERQDLRPWGYGRAKREAACWGLKPFRPWKILPGERNYILWKASPVPGGRGRRGVPGP
jgi:hypothetical protein